MRLLLVEDNQELSELMIRGFEQSGLAADAVATLDEARIVLQTRYYDALVLDLGLPDGDALSLVSELKAAKSQIPIIILTARDGIGDRVKGLRAGADDYLVKPFAIEELNARLEALMRRFPGGPSQSLKLGNVELVVEQDSGSVLIDGQLQNLLAPRCADPGNAPAAQRARRLEGLHGRRPQRIGRHSQRHRGLHPSLAQIA